MSRPAASLTGRDVLRILRKRKWLIILSVVISTALAFGGTLIWRIYAPFYMAEALIRVDVPRPSVLASSNPIASTADMERLQATTAQIANSEPVLRDALKQEKVRSTFWYQANARNSVKELGDAVSVTPVRGTDFIRVSMTQQAPTGKHRAQLADIVTAVAEAAVGYIRKTGSEERTRESETLRTQRDSLQDKLIRIQTDIQQSQEGLQESPTVAQQEVGGLISEIRLIESRKIAAENRLEQIKKIPEEELALVPEIQALIAGDPSLQRLRAEEAALKAGIDSSKLGRDHPAMQMYVKRLESVQRDIAAKSKSALADAVRAYVGLLQKELDAQVAQYDKTAEVKEEKQKRLKAVEKKLEERRQKYEEAAGYQAQIEKLNNKMLDLRLLQDDQQIILARPAEIPQDPSRPQWGLMMPLGVLLGLLIGLGLTFLLEFIDTSIKSPSDLLRRVDLPLLGMVPYGDDLEEEIGDVRLAFATHPDSLIGEAFRQIRTCLLFSGPLETRRSLLITSPLPEDGRGTVAMNLAASVARGGRKALVIDANFRQPMVHNLFPAAPEGGLSSALVGQAAWRDMVHEIEPNFHVMTAGPLPPNPSELLGSDAMRQLIDEMIRDYEQVIFDGPPCLLVTDPTVLGALVDGVIIVARAGANTYGIIQRSRDVFLRVGAHILGVVLNGVKVTAGGYFRRNYDAFYAYHEQPQLKAS